VRVLEAEGADFRSPPAWSPDGDRIAFATEDARIQTIGPAGGDAATLTKLDEASVLDLAWSPDGARIAFVATARSGTHGHGEEEGAEGETEEPA
jgi:Tol biopolymer transport system component